MSFYSIEAINSYLESIPKFQTSGKSAAKFDLDRFRKFCNEIGNPEAKYPTVHVAGTNGKGSTCQILAAIYQRAGYKLGIYTSPHVLNFSERFKINGIEISDAKLLEFFNNFEHLLENHDLSYFEISTAIAFWYFCNQKVDLAIIEVGLGGRLDATNIIKPEVSVITNISLDHTDILGNSVKEIAREKAGIIKPHVPVVLGNVSEQAKSEIRQIAEDKQSPLFDTKSLRPEYSNGRYLLYPGRKKISLKSDLITPVQAYNIAAAWQVTQLLNDRFPIAESHFIHAIAEVRSIYPSMGRFEKLLPDVEWYFDGAHNPEAVKAMKEMAGTIHPVEDAVLVLAMMKDKINKHLINEFSVFKKIFYHELNTQRSAGIDEIKQHLPTVELFPVSKKQQKLIFEEFESELVIFAGSFYFYSTVRDWIATFTDNR